jgi:hypothetical protein
MEQLTNAQLAHLTGDEEYFVASCIDWKIKQSYNSQMEVSINRYSRWITKVFSEPISFPNRN